MTRSFNAPRFTLIALLAVALAAVQTHGALVSYYPLDGNLVDVVGGFNGTENNGPFTYAAGQFSGQAVDLNGSNQFATLTTGANFGLGGNFTVSAFINSDNLSADHTVLGNDGGSGNNTLHLITRGNVAHLGFYANDQGGATPLSTGTWTHVAYQFNGGTQAIYVNGVLDASSGGHAAFAGTANNVLLGRWGGGNYFDGRIDNLAIYNDALAPNQIAYLASGGNPQTLPAVPPKVNWDFGTLNLQGWTVINGAAFLRSGDGDGVTPANAGGGFAHDPAHVNFLLRSPVFHFDGGTLDGVNAIMVEFAGGNGNQSGNLTLANFPNPASVIGYNGGNTNSGGVKAVGVLDLETMQYLGFIADPSDGNTPLSVSLTLAQLNSMGVVANKAYRLDFFENDDGGWGWSQLNGIMVAGSLGNPPVPEPATAALGLLALAALGVRRRRAA